MILKGRADVIPFQLGPYNYESRYPLAASRSRSMSRMVTALPFVAG